MFWFENRPDINVSYRFADTLEIARDPDMWQQPELMTGTNLGADRTSQDLKLPRPVSFSQAQLYQYVTGQEFLHGHDAVVDCEGLEHILLAHAVAPVWKSIARRKLFR
jgi:hypothetical protein